MNKRHRTIPAFGAAVSHYTFAPPPQAADITLRATLFLRRSFYDDMERRGWGEDDIPIAEVTKVIEYIPMNIYYLPLVIR